MKVRVERLQPALREDFYRVHSPENGEGWCNCVAWWVPTWEGWDQRTAEENRALRDKLIERGESDGYLLYADDQPIGWCQAGPRDRHTKLLDQRRLEPSAETWSVTCFVIAPKFRGRGLALALLQEVLRDLASRGARHVQGFPKRGKELSAGDVWTGPEALFVRAGFQLEKPDERFPVYGIRLA